MYYVRPYFCYLQLVLCIGLPVLIPLLIKFRKDDWRTIHEDETDNEDEQDKAGDFVSLLWTSFIMFATVI